MSPAPVKKTATPAVERVSFGALELYSGGFTLPEGDYALFFEVIMEREHEKSKGPRRLGVEIQAYPLAGGDPVLQFMSMGSKMHLSFAPDPNDGKGLVRVPGGPGATFNNRTNWFIFLESLYNCGMPAGTLDNDFTTIDGVWVHTGLIDEPADRKGFGTATGEVEVEQKGPRQIPIVTEIKDEGKPWEGTGGMPTEDAPKVAAKTAPKAAPKAAAKAAPVVEEAAAEEDEDAVKQAAINAVSTVLAKPANAKGMAKLILRTAAFKVANDTDGGDVGQQVMNTFLKEDDALAGLLGEMGYKLEGNQVKPV